MDHEETSDKANQVGEEMDKVIGAERAAQDAAMKAGAVAGREKEREPIQYPPEVEARFKVLEDTLASIIKQNCLRTEGGR